MPAKKTTPKNKTTKKVATQHTISLTTFVLFSVFLVISIICINYIKDMKQLEVLTAPVDPAPQIVKVTPSVSPTVKHVTKAVNKLK